MNDIAWKPHDLRHPHHIDWLNRSELRCRVQECDVNRPMPASGQDLLQRIATLYNMIRHSHDNIIWPDVGSPDESTKGGGAIVMTL